MGEKFIIWTMQRSGGTSLTRVFDVAGEYKNVKHEPYNGNQCFGHVRSGRPRESNKATVLDYYSTAIEETLANNNVSLKHCYEVHDELLNQALFDVSSRMNYIHILLIRNNNFERQISLELAKKTGIWSRSQQLSSNTDTNELPALDINAILKHELECQEKQRVIRSMSEPFSPNNIVYEELYKGSLSARLDYLAPTFAALNIEQPNKARASNLGIDNMLINSKQNSAAIYKRIPNFEEARNAFEEKFEIRVSESIDYAT